MAKLLLIFASSAAAKLQNCVTTPPRPSSRESTKRLVWRRGRALERPRRRLDAASLGIKNASLVIKRCRFGDYHVNAMSTPCQQHVNAMSTPRQRHQIIAYHTPVRTSHGQMNRKSPAFGLNFVIFEGLVALVETVVSCRRNIVSECWREASM